MGALQLNEAIFEESVGWIQHYKDGRFDQRYRIENGLIFCETILTTRAATAAVVALLQQEWDWWDNGKLISYRRNSDGSSEMDLKPISWYFVNVHMRILPPEDLPEWKGIRLPVIYSRHFEGPSTIDVYPKPGGNEVVLRGRFQGVRHNLPMPFVPAGMVAKMHLNTESGTLRFPFPKGTGYFGLAQRLEAK